MRGPWSRSSAVWVLEVILIRVFGPHLIVKDKRRISQILISNLASEHLGTLENLGKSFNKLLVLDSRLQKRA